MDKKEVWYEFTVSFMKKIEYPMHATSLTFDDWEEIMKPALPPLQSTWYCQNLEPPTTLLSSCLQQPQYTTPILPTTHPSTRNTD